MASNLSAINWEIQRIRIEERQARRTNNKNKPWQNLALRIIRDLSIPKPHRNLIFHACKHCEQAARFAYIDCKELGRHHYLYFLKLFNLNRMRLYKTTETENLTLPLIMMVYGEGGVGKTTFAATAPKPLIVDCENGAKFLGKRGLVADVAQVNRWEDMAEVMKLIKDFQTIVIDPIGELMEKLRDYMVRTGNLKLIQKDGNPTMAGWGWLKQTMRSYLRALRDSGKHVIIVAHITEKTDEDRVLKRPLIMTKLSEELINMVDVVGYMTVMKQGEKEAPVIIVNPSSDKFVAKDRTGVLPTMLGPNPNFTEIYNQIIQSQTTAQGKKQTIADQSVQSETTPQTNVRTTTSPAKVETTKQEASKTLVCAECGKEVNQIVADYSYKAYGAVLCMSCQHKVRKDLQKAAAAQEAAKQQ